MEEEDSKKMDETALSAQENTENTIPNSASIPAVYGHHYYNPQWVMYDTQTPALLYNNAVHFTVSFDGTHYFHEQYQGQFCAPPEATMVSFKTTFTSTGIRSSTIGSFLIKIKKKKKK